MSEKIEEVFVNDDIIENWYEKAKHIKNPDELKEFIENVYSFGEYPGYDECVHAMTSIAIAASWCANKHYKITGFQASCVGLEYLLHWTYDYRNTIGISVINWSDMLYPQKDHLFEKTITKDIFKALQEAAQKNLKAEETSSIPAHPRVIEHWQSIVNGIVPFGYELVE